MFRFALALGLSFAAAIAGAAPGPAAVDDARLRAADADAANWMSHGRTYAEQRFSPLAEINDGNVARLGLAWSQTLDFDRGVEATPLVVDGVMYVTGPWSVVYAFDAATGTPLWQHDPQVNRAQAVEGCCGPVNRGVAVWEGRVYVGTLDGRLVALDAASGKQAWSVDTLIDASRGYNITGAPRVVKGKVLIGNGGADMGARGYVSAYDATTGAMAWRFFTVPGDPSKGFENATMEMAAKTWSGEEWWKWGGGGTVWDAMSYDPELDLLYIGVGNSSLYPRARRSPGGGDNLFVSSIVALRPDTGEYVWHYQLAPAEQWDYPATTQMVLLDIPFQGELRKLLVQVPKHGFVYVLDRVTGKLLSAEKFTKVTWASGYDLATGRPIENPQADYSKTGKAELVYPGPLGGHNWNPVSWNPGTGLLYFSELQMPSVYKIDHAVGFKENGRRYNMALDMAGMMDNPAFLAELRNPRGSLIAWDVANAKIAWQVPQPMPTNGGTLSTAGNLVFHGTADGRLVAYAADSGKQLWEGHTFGGVQAGPVSYAVDGRQYVAAGIGWGGGHGAAMPDGGKLAGLTNPSRIAVYTLDGKATLEPPAPFTGSIDPPPLGATPEQIRRGAQLYMVHCGYCHASGSGGVPDLNYLGAQAHSEFMAIVRGGLRLHQGMPAFGEQLTEDDANAVHAFLIAQAQRAKAGM